MSTTLDPPRTGIGAAMLQREAEIAFRNQGAFQAAWDEAMLFGSAFLKVKPSGEMVPVSVHELSAWLAEETRPDNDR